MKKNYFVKALSVLFTLCLILGSLPLSAVAGGKPVIKTVKIVGATVDIKAGDTPKFTGKSAEPDLYDVSTGDGYEMWYDEAAGQYLSSNDFYNAFAQEGELITKFIKGHTYKYSVAVQAKDPEWNNNFACNFDENTKISINGKTYSVPADKVSVTDFFGENYYILFSWVITVKLDGKVSASNAKISLSKTSYTYDGKAKKPAVTVKDAKGKKIAASNYKVSYSNNKNVGKATVKVTFMGNYTGTKTATFKINPKGTSISSVTPASKALTIKWKKQATQTKGYEIQLATDSAFKKNVKKVTVSGAKTVSKKVTGIAAGKSYYVRIRTYSVVNGTKYYSSWSKAVKAKTKK